jgi:hypothetical protein
MPEIMTQAVGFINGGVDFTMVQDHVRTIRTLPEWTDSGKGTSAKLCKAAEFLKLLPRRDTIDFLQKLFSIPIFKFHMVQDQMHVYQNIPNLKYAFVVCVGKHYNKPQNSHSGLKVGCYSSNPNIRNIIR